MNTIAIAGVGLIGGSFSLALQKAGFQGRILGISSPPTIEAAMKAGVIHAGVTLEQACAEADFFYLAQPILAIMRTIDAIADMVRPDCLVTDAGSTKSEIVTYAAARLTRCQFLGGHPMAGKTSRGVAVADADLFQSRPYVLTPTEKDHLETPSAIHLISWLQKIGAVPIVLSPDEHDRTVALTSHLPQLASSALAATLAGMLEGDQQLRVAGPGLSDTTRLAQSSFEIWEDILATNSEAIALAMDTYIDKLLFFRQNLTNPILRG
ncbi:MAG: prephenate dehydrogenase/arogenate dehydrogenase family protein, partial [Bryobacteraceae bacterium]